ncbi:MAG: hypothetical protein HUJ29_00760 [Gammaproteobacteria bacterium]|nr:hypothetical protein [Gammaproteobacteria bacterium]
MKLNVFVIKFFILFYWWLKKNILAEIIYIFMFGVAPLLIVYTFGDWWRMRDLFYQQYPISEMIILNGSLMIFSVISNIVSHFSFKYSSKQKNFWGKVEEVSRYLGEGFHVLLCVVLGSSLSYNVLTSIQIDNSFDYLIDTILNWLVFVLFLVVLLTSYMKFLVFNGWIIGVDKIKESEGATIKDLG